MTDIICGVTLGSTLGPYWFMLFKNDLSDYLLVYTSFYADDINIFIEAKNVTDLYVKGNYTRTRLQA